MERPLGIGAVAVDDDGQRVALLAVEQHVELDQIAADIALQLVVEGRVARACGS